MAKIAIQVDNYAEHGHFLTSKEMRKLSHNIGEAFDLVEVIAVRREYTVETDLCRPATDVHGSIVDILSAFALGGRYNHLDSLGGSSGAKSAERQWEADVISPLAGQHLTARKRLEILGQEKSTSELSERLSENAVIRLTDLDGEVHTTLESSHTRIALCKATVPWSRLYTLQIGRWLANILRELGCLGPGLPGEPTIPYLNDFFSWLVNDDAHLRRRKTFVIRR
ncbi:MULTISPECIES: hypothetical protein [unclassified Rhodococcus (in: high G+C Gram-positive bacteria)]|uniref:hypothetical protein n=1 Tax=unclassified Rhodococcus (in: high G+C Gram-positive bacteria) TaxID=192944 RepID=UPI00117AA14E|nr:MULTISPECIES: hypothetical protein [unclassified Rhodococcus (in: high G+C Gram-positive bacteria)]